MLLLFQPVHQVILKGMAKGQEDESKRSPIRFTSADDSMIVDLNLDLKDPSDLPSEEPEVEFSKVLGTEIRNENYDVPGFDYTTIKEQMLMEVIKYLGTPYKYGGTTKNGIDCSAFTQMLYKDVLKLISKDMPGFSLTRAGKYWVKMNYSLAIWCFLTPGRE